jgi:hypothetical protein
LASAPWNLLKGLAFLTHCQLTRETGIPEFAMSPEFAHTELADKDIVRIYGKRWDIEMFFKLAKQHLKLAKEIQCRDFDALIAHATIVFMRYMFLVYQWRIETDHRTLGDLFYACCDEVADISFF